MSSQAKGLRVASVIFLILMLAHVVRLISSVEVTVGTMQVPMWASVVGIIIAGTLSLWFWRLSSRG